MNVYTESIDLKDSEGQAHGRNDWFRPFRITVGSAEGDPVLLQVFSKHADRPSSLQAPIILQLPAHEMELLVNMLAKACQVGGTTPVCILKAEARGALMHYMHAYGYLADREALDQEADVIASEVPEEYTALIREDLRQFLIDNGR